MAEVKKTLEANENFDITTLLSKPWQKFLAKFDEIQTLRTSQWKEVHFLGHICKRYLGIYGKAFALSYKGAPSKCTEIFMVKRMIAMLGTSNPHVIKAYIDWVYDKKIIAKDFNFRAIGFFCNTSMVNEFQIVRAKQSKIEKSTELPNEYKEAANVLELTVNTYGDLAFIKMALDQSAENERIPYRTLFNNLMAIGFEPSVLKDLL